MTQPEAELTAALAASQRHTVELEQEIKFQKQKIDSLVRRISGAGTGKMDTVQLDLFMAGIGST